MTSALLPQCARPLLVVVVVVPVLLLCCCRPADAQQPDLKNFTCAKTGANLPGGLTIPMDNQIRIDAQKRDKNQQQLRVLLLNATDEKPKMTLVAGPSCQSVFSPASVNSSTCDVGKANNVSQKHAPNECPDADGCKEFSFNCPMARDANLSASVFNINMKDFQPIDEQQCKGRAYIYIDNVRLLMYGGPMSDMVEKCPAEGSKKATNGSAEATTTNSANTTTTGSTETTTTGSTKTTTTGSTETTTTGSTETTTTGSTKTTTTGSTETTTTSSADTTTTSSADTTTTNSANATTTNSSNTTTTGSTETMGSTETSIIKDGTMIIILSVLGAGLFIAVAAAVVCVLCRRKGTSEDVAALEVEEDEKSAATTPTKAPSPKTEGVEVPDSAYSKASQDEDGSTAVDGSTTA